LIIGAGVAAMHFLGMHALIVQGHLHWNTGLSLIAIVGGLALAAAAMETFQRLPRRRAVWVSPILLTLAICFLHFTAMGAVGVEYDSTAVVVPNLIADNAMALVVAGGATLIMISALGAAAVNGLAQRRSSDAPSADDLQQGKGRAAQAEPAVRHGLGQHAAGLCMFDAALHLVVCNKRYAEIYGIPPELTRPGTPLINILKHRFASGVQTNLDPEAFVRDRIGRLHETTRIEVLKDGRIIRATRRPTGSGELIAIHEDITEPEKLGARLKLQNELLQQRERELRSRNADLDAALTTMKHGIAMFDADERLVVTNQRYAEVYGLTNRPAKPGMTLREIVEVGVAEGGYAGKTVEEVLQTTRQLAACKTGNEVLSRPRSDLILSVSFNPRSEGGWVVSVSDVTEREPLNTQLQQ
jgi:PAS domain-containing protein